MKKLVSSAVILLVTFGSQAVGQTMVGPRIEILGGLETRVPGQGAAGDSRPLLGARLGYDVGVGSRVAIGLDAEISGLAHSDDTHFVVPAPCGLFLCGAGSPTTGYTYRTRTGRNIYAGARISFAVTHRLGLYVTGGYTNQRVSACSFMSALGDCQAGAPPTPAPFPPPSISPAAVINDSATRNLGAYRAGGGVSVALDRHLLASLEYRHAFYGNASVAPFIVSGIGYVRPYGDTNQIVMSLGWRF